MRAPGPTHALEIRDATSADASRLAEIYNDAVASGRATMDKHPVDAGYFRALLKAFSPRESLLAGEVGGHLVGWAIAKRYSDREGYAVACETSVYLAAGETGKGYGVPLLEAIVERADRAGYRHLVAKIMAVNEGSIRFHERHGYERVGVQHRIGVLNGVWHDVVILERLLDGDAPR